MDLPALLLVFTTLLKMSFSLQCYKCESQFVNYNENLCQHFDYSEKYVVACEHSTMCYKRETTSNLGNGIKIYERGCAKQTINGDQERTSEGWKPVNRVYEAYEEGCADNPANPDRVTNTVNCYCRGDFCNGTVMPMSGRLILLLMIGLLILVRY